MNRSNSVTGLFARLQLRANSSGLIPVVVQDASSRDVLMMAFMNEQALAATFSTGRAHFYSRSRRKLWRKGEVSGHEQIVEEVFVNCEANCLLLSVNQVGAVCHDGYPTCFYRRLDADGTVSVVREQVFDPADVYARPIPRPTIARFAAAPAAGAPSPPRPRPAPAPAPSASKLWPEESSPSPPPEPWDIPSLRESPPPTMEEPAPGGYPTPPQPSASRAPEPAASLEELTRLLYGALAYLRDHDLTSVSKTSQRLWREHDTVSPRVADELRELAGVLDRTHGHGGFDEDVTLESTQVLYWTLLSALRNHISFDWLRPDLALETVDPEADLAETARRLRSEARRWESGFAPEEDHGINCHAALVLVGQACHVAGISPLSGVEADLAEMRGRRYLAAYFAEALGS